MILSVKPKTSDKKLFSRLQKKDKDAFIEAYDKHIDDIYRFVFYKVSDREEAEDLTSQVFLKAWNYVQMNTIKDYKTLKALLYKISRNLIIDHYRKQSVRQTEALETEDRKHDIPDDSQNIHEKLEIKSEFKLIEQNLLKIKDEYREVIVMRYINEMSFSEIAQVVDKSKGNVRVILYRAMKALKDLSK